MSRRSRRGSRREKGKVAGWIYGGIGLVIIALIVGAAIVMNMGMRPTDRTSACPTDHYDTVTAVLVDLTDKVRATPAEAVRNALLKIRNDVPRYGRLEIYPLTSTTAHTIEPLFAGCNPGSARDVFSRVFGNPELADRLWKKQFADKIEQVAAEIQKLPEARNSPLLEGIQSVAVTAFGTPMAEPAQKQLVVISDMIHNTPELDMYRGVPIFDRFKSTAYFLKTMPMLRKANVDVFLIVRDTSRNVQQPPLYKFWVEFTAAGGGFLRNWEPLQ